MGETWTNTKAVRNKSRILQKIITRLLGDGHRTYCIRISRELEELPKRENIVTEIKSLRLTWFGHTARMNEKRTVKAVVEYRPIHGRLKRKPIEGGKVIQKEALKI